MIFRGPNTHHGRGSPRSAIVGNQRVSIQGQSNAVGRAERSEIAQSPLSADAALATYDAGTFDRVYIWNGSAYAKLQPSVNNKCNAGQFGPEFGLAVRWMRETDTALLFLDKEATGGVSITYFLEGTGVFSTSVSTHASANAWLATNSISVTDAGWLWVQGESDAGQTQAWYENHLTNYVASRINNGLQASGAKRVIAQMQTGTAAYDANIVAAKTAYAASNPNTVKTVTLSHMQGDNLHSNGQGQVQLGYDAFERLFDATHITA